MKLDRNINLGEAKGKYAVVKLRKLKELTEREYVDAKKAIDLLYTLGLLIYGAPRTPDEFFVIKLSDPYARQALLAYQGVAWQDDREYAADVAELAMRSGELSPFCKKPD